MEKITLNQLKRLPNESIITYEAPSGLYVWKGFTDNELFGYAVPLSNPSTDNLDDHRERFYYRKDFQYAKGDEAFYTYSRQDLDYLIFAAARAKVTKDARWTLPTKAQNENT